MKKCTNVSDVYHVCVLTLWLEILTVRWWFTSTHTTLSFAHKQTRTLCCDGCSSGQCLACCWLSKSAPAQINNGAKEAFSCRSTPSTPNTKVDDSAVRCPLSCAHAGVEQARPVGATCVKAWNSVLLTARFFLCPLQSQSKQGESSKHPYILISSSAQCRVYLSRLWLGWTVIRYAATHTHTHTGA